MRDKNSEVKARQDIVLNFCKDPHKNLALLYVGIPGAPANHDGSSTMISDSNLTASQSQLNHSYTFEHNIPAALKGDLGSLI